MRRRFEIQGIVPARCFTLVKMAYVSALLLSLLAGVFLPGAGMAYYTLEPAKPEGLHQYQYRQLGRQIIKSTRVDINRASLTELHTLPGITTDVALKIIRYRKQHPIEKPEDLYQLPSLSAASLYRLIQNIKDRLEFSPDRI